MRAHSRERESVCVSAPVGEVGAVRGCSAGSISSVRLKYPLCGAVLALALAGSVRKALFTNSEQRRALPDASMSMDRWICQLMGFLRDRAS